MEEIKIISVEIENFRQYYGNSKIDFIPKFRRYDPPTDKYSIFEFCFFNFEITTDANRSPDGSPVSTNIFFI